MLFESNSPGAVAVCGNGSLLTHTTRSPRRTSTFSGAKRVPSMSTVWVSAATASLEGAAVSARATHIARAARVAPVYDTPSALTLLAKFALKSLGVLQMRRESRPHLDEQRFQFGILRVRNEHLVQRIDDGLVIGDLPSDVGAIVLGALELVQPGKVLG